MRDLTRRQLLGAAALAGAAALSACSGSGSWGATGGYGVGEVAPAVGRDHWPGLTGIADASGGWVVTPRWDEEHLGDPQVSAAGDTAAVRAVSKPGGLYGYVGCDGAWAVAPSLRRARGFSACGLATAQAEEDDSGRGNNWGYLADDGSWALGPGFSRRTGDFGADGTALADVSEDPSTTSRRWIRADGSDADPFLPWAVERFASSGSGGLWGLRDQGGSWVLEPSLAGLSPLLVERSFLAKDPSSGLWGTIASDGSWLLAPAWGKVSSGYYNARPHLGDAFFARDAGSGLWGVVAPDGSWEVGPSFRAICDYAGGRVVAGATKDGPWGVAESDGTWLTEPAYSDVQWMSAADVFLVTVPEEG